MKTQTNVQVETGALATMLEQQVLGARGMVQDALDKVARAQATVRRLEGRDALHVDSHGTLNYRDSQAQRMDEAHAYRTLCEAQYALGAAQAAHAAYARALDTVRDAMVQHAYALHGPNSGAAMQHNLERLHNATSPMLAAGETQRAAAPVWERL